MPGSRLEGLFDQAGRSGSGTTHRPPPYIPPGILHPPVSSPEPPACTTPARNFPLAPSGWRRSEHEGPSEHLDFLFLLTTLGSILTAVVAFLLAVFSSTVPNRCLRPACPRLRVRPLPAMGRPSEPALLPLLSMMYPRTLSMTFSPSGQVRGRTATHLAPENSRNRRLPHRAGCAEMVPWRRCPPQR